METVYAYRNETYKTYMSNWDWFECIIISIPLSASFFIMAVGCLNISYWNALSLSFPVYLIVLICAIIMARARNMQIDFQKQLSDLKERVEKLENKTTE